MTNFLWNGLMENILILPIFVVKIHSFNSKFSLLKIIVVGGGGVVCMYTIRLKRQGQICRLSIKASKLSLLKRDSLDAFLESGSHGSYFL